MTRDVDRARCVLRVLRVVVVVVRHCVRLCEGGAVWLVASTDIVGGGRVHGGSMWVAAREHVLSEIR